MSRIKQHIYVTEMRLRQRQSREREDGKQKYESFISTSPSPLVTITHYVLLNHFFKDNIPRGWMEPGTESQQTNSFTALKYPADRNKF
jgi:hypothetical protein